MRQHVLNHDALIGLIRSRQERVKVSRFRSIEVPSLREIAKETGMTASTISRLRHKKDISGNKLLKLLLWLVEVKNPDGDDWDKIMGMVIRRSPENKNNKNKESK